MPIPPNTPRWVCPMCGTPYLASDKELLTRVQRIHVKSHAEQMIEDTEQYLRGEAL